MWQLIRANKRNSIILLVLMAWLLMGVGFLVGSAFGGPRMGLMGVVIATAVWFVMLLVSYYQGDQVLLASSRAQKVTHDVHPQLFNVVEEITIAANLPKMPDIYIINDPALNAFATGRDPAHAAVAVTAGLLGRLNRDELQGVIAHEISHILHRDILFVTMAGIMLGTIVLISQVFLRATLYGGVGRSRYSSRSRNDQGQIIMIVIALACAILAPIFAQLLYFALSRRREYLADAGSARLTRYPEGLARALEKIAHGGARVATANKVTAPMYIINPLTTKANLSAWTSTHPPIKDRIRILRNMSHGASYLDYEKSYEQLTNDRVIPAAALKEEEQISLRSGAAAGAVAAAATGVDLRSDIAPDADSGAGSGTASRRRQMRQVGDIMHRVNQLIFLTCACGMKLKIPPTYKHAHVKCPRCGKVLPVPTARSSA